MNANLRNFALWVIIVLLLLALFTLFQGQGPRTQSQEISFSQLLNETDAADHQRVFSLRNVTSAGVGVIR